MTGRGKGKGILTAASLVALMLAALVGPGSASAAFPGTNGKIVFTSDRESGTEIWTIAPTLGATAQRITDSFGSDEPAWSPNASKIAFVNSDNEIAVMNSNGSGVTPLTSGVTAKQEPTWSPDGTKIAFVASTFELDGGTDLEIWVMNANGTGAAPLTANTAEDSNPAWSPLGDKIAFVGTRSGDTNDNIYVMNANGSGEVSITPNVGTDCSPSGTLETCWGGNDVDPAWSPDGLKIAWTHPAGLAGGGELSIWAMNPDGSGKDHVAGGPVTSYSQPAWSPEGDMIAAVGVSSGTTDRDIWVMSADGTTQDLLDGNPAHDIDPDWGVPSPASPSPVLPAADLIPPDTQITDQPKNKIKTRKKKVRVRWEFGSTEGGSLQCRVDGAPFQPCVSPFSKKLKLGRHTFEVQSFDAAGNADGTPASDKVKIIRKQP